MGQSKMDHIYTSAGPLVELKVWLHVPKALSSETEENVWAHIFSQWLGFLHACGMGATLSQQIVLRTVHLLYSHVHNQHTRDPRGAHIRLIGLRRYRWAAKRGSPCAKKVEDGELQEALWDATCSALRISWNHMRAVLPAALFLHGVLGPCLMPRLRNVSQM